MKNYIEKDFLKEIFKHFDKETIKVVMYGSFTLKNKGDFDVAVICEKYNKEQKKAIKEILENLHRKFGLRIDEDVPYFNKALFNTKECNGILKAPPFALENGKARIFPFYGNDEYFVSDEARYRLLVNLLTTNVKVLHGNINTERENTFQMLIGVIFSTLNNRVLNIKEIVQHLCVDPYSYYSYKRYLGYNPIKDYKFLKKNVRKNIIKMKKTGKVKKSKNGYTLSKEHLNFINNLEYGKLITEENI